MRRRDDGNESAGAAFYPQTAPYAPRWKIFPAPVQRFSQPPRPAPRQVFSGALAACGDWKRLSPASGTLLPHRRCEAAGLFDPAHLQPASCDGLIPLRPGNPCRSAGSSSVLRSPGAWACEFSCGQSFLHRPLILQQPWMSQSSSSAVCHGRSLNACDGGDESHRRRISPLQALLFSGRSFHLKPWIFYGRNPHLKPWIFYGRNPHLKPWIFYRRNPHLWVLYVYGKKQISL